jgi:DNA primase catalytic subunit
MKTTPINPQEIYRYYASDSFKPVLPYDVSHRHFRFKLADGSWRKCKRVIRSEEELQCSIVKMGGVDIYYSTSRWLMPHRISAKGDSGTYFVANNCLLGNDLTFDIDAPAYTLKGLDLARKSCANILKAMREFPQYEFMGLHFTGRMGFRLIYSYHEFELPEDPRQRLDYLETNRKLFIELFRKLLESRKKEADYYSVAPLFDDPITYNPMCVIRVPGTVHSGTGFICCEIPRAIIRKPIKTVLNHVPYIGKARPGIPTREMTKGSENKGNTFRVLGLNNMVKDVTGLSSFAPSYHYFISNKVLGVKRGFVPIFVYPNTSKYWEKEAIQLQEKFKLGSLYVYRNEKNIFVVSVKTMQRRQLQKLLLQSSSRAKYDFKKHNRVLFPLALRYIKKIRGEYTGHLSRGHISYVADKPSKDVCGWNKVELIRAETND